MSHAAARQRRSRLNLSTGAHNEDYDNDPLHLFPETHHHESEDAKLSAAILKESVMMLETPAVDGARPRNRRKSVRPSDFTMRLYAYEEVPHWVRNKFIEHGYRAHYTLWMCLKSLFTIHNETANVWTHLLGMLFFIFFTIIACATLLKPVLSHYLIFIPFALASIICMGFSAAFHLFSGHYCQHVYDRMMQLDYFGITCLVVGSFLPPCYFAFTCEPWLRVLYLGMIGVLGSVGLAGPFFGFWADAKFFWCRLLIYTLMGGSGIFPVVHVNFIMPGGTASPHVLGLAIIMALYFFGMMIYILKIPECFFPGRFDVWFHSHMIWHVFVLAASVIHFVNCLAMYLHWEPMEIHC